MVFDTKYFLLEPKLSAFYAGLQSEDTVESEVHMLKTSICVCMRVSVCMCYHRYARHMWPK